VSQLVTWSDQPLLTFEIGNGGMATMNAPSRDRFIFVYAILSIAAACGGVDDRPETLEYISVAVLAPNCAPAQCHSAFRAEGGYAFDTVAAARKSLQQIVVPEEPEGSLLMTVLTRPVDRMPLDQPLADADQDLIRRWIEQGAPGLVP
jgi:hypothetical protein